MKTGTVPTRIVTAALFVSAAFLAIAVASSPQCLAFDGADAAESALSQKIDQLLAFRQGFVGESAVHQFLPEQLDTASAETATAQQPQSAPSTSGSTDASVNPESSQAALAQNPATGQVEDEDVFDVQGDDVGLLATADQADPLELQLLALPVNGVRLVETEPNDDQTTATDTGLDGSLVDPLLPPELDPFASVGFEDNLMTGLTTNDFYTIDFVAQGQQIFVEVIAPDLLVTILDASGVPIATGSSGEGRVIRGRVTRSGRYFIFIDKGGSSTSYLLNIQLVSQGIVVAQPQTGDVLNVYRRVALRGNAAAFRYFNPFLFVPCPDMPSPPIWFDDPGLTVGMPEQGFPFYDPDNPADLLISGWRQQLLVPEVVVCDVDSDGNGTGGSDGGIGDGGDGGIGDGGDDEGDDGGIFGGGDDGGGLFGGGDGGGLFGGGDDDGGLF